MLRPLPSSRVNIPVSPFAMWPVGLMDKASASGAGDSRFESWAGHLFTWKAIWKTFGLIAFGKAGSYLGSRFLYIPKDSLETHEHQWSSGRIHRCHRCDPGSIPG